MQKSQLLIGTAASNAKPTFGFMAEPSLIFVSVQTPNKALGRVYSVSISDIHLYVSPSKKLWMQNRTKALGLYYFPSSWMYPLDVQNGCALEHSLGANYISHSMKTSHPTKKTQVHWTQKNVPHFGEVFTFMSLL